MDLQQEIAAILQSGPIRSADRAQLRRLLDEIKRGRPLTYQDRQNLWAYIDRYSEHR